MTRKPSPRTHPVDTFTRTAVAACFVALCTFAGCGIDYLLSAGL